MNRQWILVADAAHARILATNGNLKKAVHVQSFDNPKARLHGKDFTTHKPGRVYSGDGSHAATADEGNPKEMAVVEYARKLAHALGEGRQHGSYERLAIVAPPHMLGLLKQELDPSTQKLLTTTVPKDLARQNTKELVQHLEKLLG